MAPRDKIKEFTEFGRRYRVVYSWHSSPAAAGVSLASVIRNQMEWPEGYHFWTGRVQKSAGGRRASLQVVYQEDRKRSTA